MNFDAFVKDIEENKWNVFGAEVYKAGQLVHSFGDTVENRHPIYSATKAVTSIAVGMATDEGKLDIDACILKYLPNEIICEMSKRQIDTYKHISMKRLLTMSVKGYPFRAKGENWLKYSLNIPLEDVQTKAFDYSNIPAYLVGVATACALNEDLYEFLDRRLFTPLGITKPPYERCPSGYFYGASKMELTVNEFSRLGLLLYNYGVYKGHRIVSEEYVKAATSIQQMNREGGYGYFIWKYRDGFSINGKLKQKCYVLPREQKIITYLSHIEDDACALKESMEKNILDDVGDF